MSEQGYRRIKNTESSEREKMCMPLPLQDFNILHVWVWLATRTIYNQQIFGALYGHDNWQSANCRHRQGEPKQLARCRVANEFICYSTLHTTVTTYWRGYFILLVQLEHELVAQKSGWELSRRWGRYWASVAPYWIPTWWRRQSNHFRNVVG